MSQLNIKQGCTHVRTPYIVYDLRVVRVSVFLIFGTRGALLVFGFETCVALRGFGPRELFIVRGRIERHRYSFTHSFNDIRLLQG